MTDRFAGSTIAYQGYGRGLDSGRLAALVGWATGGLAADLSVLVDVPVDVAAARLAAGGRGRGRPARAPRPGLRRRVREGFLAQAAADPGRLDRRRRRRRRSRALTAHILASVRERLGDPPAPAPVSGGPPGHPSSSPASWGRTTAVAALRAAAANPVHAYLFRGPPGNGGLAAAYGFAAALLCPDGGCGECATCRAALAGTDPDLHVVRRSGASVSTETMRQVVALAQRRPLHAARQVIVVLDVHLGRDSCTGPAQDAGGAAGRHGLRPAGRRRHPRAGDDRQPLRRGAFPPVPRAELVRWLTASGVAPDMAAVVADSSGGNPERARVMVDDPDVAARVALWASVPDELTASGMTAAGLTRRVLESADRAVEPLRAAHAREIEALTAAAKEMGERGLPGRKEIVEQHQREERRFRTDALRAGLGVLARAYRGRVVRRGPSGRVAVGDPDVRSAAEAVGLITETAEALPRNPNESLLLQSLFVRLAALAA